MLLQLEMLKADMGSVSAQEAHAMMGDLEESHLSVEEMGLRGLCNMEGGLLAYIAIDNEG